MSFVTVSILFTSMPGMFVKLSFISGFFVFDFGRAFLSKFMFGRSGVRPAFPESTGGNLIVFDPGSKDETVSFF